jgi:hypothetical protein
MLRGRKERGGDGKNTGERKRTQGGGGERGGDGATAMSCPYPTTRLAIVRIDAIDRVVIMSKWVTSNNITISYKNREYRYLALLSRSLHITHAFARGKTQ